MENNNNNDKKEFSTAAIIAIVAVVYGVLFLLTTAFLYFVDGKTIQDAALLALKFWSIIAGITLVIMFIQSLYEKNPAGCVVLCIIGVVGIIAVRYEMDAPNRQEAQFQEAVATIEMDVDEYIDKDVLMDYVENNLQDVIDRFELYTYEDMDRLYYDAEEAKQASYDNGWKDCCEYYGIEDEVYYTDEELAAMEGEPVEQTEPAESENETVVYITPYGERYHYKASCAGKNAMGTSLSDAQNSGYTPCQKCVA